MINRSFFAFLAGALLACACTPTLGLDWFEPEVRINTPSVRTGDALSFSVRTNHDRFTVSDFDCEWAGDFGDLSVGSTYSYDSDGWKTFESDPVTVKEKHRGTLTLTLTDPDTGESRVLTLTYLAYRRSEFSLRLLRNGAETEEPAYCDGDAVGFRLYCDTPVAVVQDISGPWLPEGFRKGAEYFVYDGYCEFDCGTVDAAAEDFSDALKVSVTDQECDETVTLSAPLTYLHAFEARLEMETALPRDGASLVFRLYSNRPEIEIIYASCEFGTIATGTKTVNRALGFLEFTFQSISVDDTHSGVIRLVVGDPSYTDSVLDLELPYTVYAN